jgi:hypothetical protein
MQRNTETTRGKVRRTERRSIEGRTRARRSV